MNILDFMAGNPWLAFGIVCVLCVTVIAVCDTIVGPIQYRHYIERVLPPRPPTKTVQVARQANVNPPPDHPRPPMPPAMPAVRRDADGRMLPPEDPVPRSDPRSRF